MQVIDNVHFVTINVNHVIMVWLVMAVLEIELEINAIVLCIQSFQMIIKNNVLNVKMCLLDVGNAL